MDNSVMNDPNMDDEKSGAGRDKSYRPRRARSGNPPPFQLTDRDREIILQVAEYRFLNSDHIRCLVMGSSKNITTRLKALFEHGYLDRPECQYNTYRPGGGSAPIAYALANRGAQCLNETEADGVRSISLASRQVSRQRVGWTHKNKSVGRPFLEHALAIADFAVGLKQSVAKSSNVNLIEGDALIARLPDETRAFKKPWRLNVPVIYGGTRIPIGVEPDYAFSLHLPKAKRRAYFLVEIDRGTMPVERFDLKQTSILRKILAYQTLWQSKAHHAQFGWRNFRVLFVSTSAERVENMIASMNANALTKDSPLFYFADKQSLYEKGNLLAEPFLDCYGNEQQLLPRKWM